MTVKKKSPSVKAEPKPKKKPPLQKKIRRQIKDPKNPGGSQYGQPEIYNEALAAYVLQIVATNTFSLKKMHERFSDFPDPATVMAWTWRHPDFFSQYLVAKQNQQLLMVDECDEMMNDLGYYTDDKGTQRVDAPTVARQLAKVNMRKWHASKLAPKFFGDRQTIETVDKSKDDEMKADMLKRQMDNDKKYKKDF